MVRKMLVSLVLGVPLAWAAASAENAALVPKPRDGHHLERFEMLSERARKAPDSRVVFIGDSITQGWEGAGKKAWEKHFADLKPLNLGIGGDRTQHVLWRLENGNIEGLNPEVAVVMIGTNNSNGDDHPAEEIAEGVTAIVDKLRVELPETKILLLAIFPRGEQPNPQREKNSKANAIIAELHDGEHVHFLDIGSRFLGDDGSISKEVMPDFLHLSPKGYEIWAEAIAPKLKELMN